MAARARAYVGVGSNSARALNLGCGLRSLAQQFGALELSTVYESAPAGGVGAAYWNLAVAFDTALNYSELRAQLKTLEDGCGRERGTQADGVVALDLDLLVLAPGDPATEVFDLPLDALLGASYVLAPLAELLPDWRHPAAGATLAELWHDCAPGTPLLSVVPPQELPPLAPDARGDMVVHT
ncbi:MAG: 2-amino-4-hydroxy-6-hydroxymethyldihydropteridine diphosphokinase [Gammaproteobacteria bacterium]